MAKLVRDRIPEIVAAEGRRQHVRRLDDGEYVDALLAKLFEEARELRAASDEERLGEAADVYEVLLAILARHGFTPEDLARTADSKRQSRGGYTERWWWEAEDC